MQGPHQGILRRHDEPPEHLVHMLKPLWRTLPTDPARPHIEPGTAEYGAAARSEIRKYVKLIWAEAFQAGAACGLAWSTEPIRLLVEPGSSADTVVEALRTALTGQAVPNAS